MKTHLRILFSLLVFATVLTPVITKAQLEKTELISFSARINEPLEIAIDDEAVVFELKTYSNYKNEMGGFGSDYSTNAKILGSSNLSMKVIPLTPMQHEDGVSEISLNSISYSTGFENDSKNGISQSVALDQPNSTNIAGTTDGANLRNLNIYWEINTKNMVSKNLKPGNYSTDVMVLFTEEI